MKESKDPMEILNEIRNRVIQGEDPLNILNVNNQENTIEEQDEADEIAQLNAEKKHLEESIRLKEQESGELQAANEEIKLLKEILEHYIPGNVIGRKQFLVTQKSVFINELVKGLTAPSEVLKALTKIDEDFIEEDLKLKANTGRAGEAVLDIPKLSNESDGI